MFRLFLLDNYDSFTWNLAHAFEELGAQVTLRQNDEIDVQRVAAEGFDGVVISPGPGRPGEAGRSMDLVRKLDGRTPLLGVCLGHQAIACSHGAEIEPAAVLMHGKTSLVHHEAVSLFEGMPRPFQATRYHSLVVRRDSLPECFRVSAWTDDGTVMAIRHESSPVHGVQFHPESIMTLEGKTLMARFLCLAAAWNRRTSHAA